MPFKEVFELPQSLLTSVAEYIDSHYVEKRTPDEYDSFDGQDLQDSFLGDIEENLNTDGCHKLKKDTSPPDILVGACPPSDYSFDEVSAPCSDLSRLLVQTDAGFSETLLGLIDRTGKKDSEIYKRANIDRKLFSKIRNNPDYKPSKTTAIAFALALELNLEETKDFIGRAGYALSHSSKFDIIIEFFILQKNYDIFEINSTLFHFDQSLLGS